MSQGGSAVPQSVGDTHGTPASGVEDSDAHLTKSPAADASASPTHAPINAPHSHTEEGRNTNSTVANAQPQSATASKTPENFALAHEPGHAMAVNTSEDRPGDGEPDQSIAMLPSAERDPSIKSEPPSEPPSQAPSQTPHQSLETPPNVSTTDVEMTDAAPAITSIFGEGRQVSPIPDPEPSGLQSEDDAEDEEVIEQPAATPEVPVKKEPAEFMGFISPGGTGQSKANPIEILDDDDDDDDCMEVDNPLPARKAVQHEQKPIREAGEAQPGQTSAGPTAKAMGTSDLKSFDLGSSSLRKKMRADQKEMARKIRSGEVNPFVKSNAPGGSPAAGPSSRSARPTNVEGSDMNWDLQVENDEDEKIRSFEAYERTYQERKAAKKTDFTEEIDFMKRKTEHESRKNRIKLEKDRQKGSKKSQESQTQDQTSPPSEEQPASSLKRMRDELGESDIESDAELDGSYSDSPEPATPKRQSKKSKDTKRASRKGPSKKDLQLSMDAGTEGKLANKEKNKRRKSNEQTSQSGSSSKGKRGRPKGGRNGGPQKSKQTKNAQVTIPAGGKQRMQLMKDFASFSNSNVYIDANENLSKGGLPEVSQRNKNDALKALIASVPEEDRRSANLDKKQIMEASKMLGHSRGLCRMDGKGGWHLKGFNGSLKHHQVLGAAFMLERETQLVGEPYGGLCADEMGFGKTIMMIANMLANQAPEGAENKTTLIVATPGLITQWMNEIAKFTAPNYLPVIYPCIRQNQLYGHGTELMFQNADVILTTYQMVLKSYPKYEPPAELVSPEEKRQWWHQHYENNRGFFHRTKFYRVVIDEAQYIKNHRARTSIACRGLMGKYRWAMSGTPIHNSIEELYPYFKFLHVKHTGSLETFKQNFCSTGSEISSARLHGFLRMFMMRRTHKDTLLNKPIINLPKNHQTTIEIDFNSVERKIYDIVRFRFMKRIEHWYRSGGQESLHKNYNNILVMLMRLRQLTSHIFLAQSTIEDLIELDDIEELWAITEKETKQDNPDKALLHRMKQLILSAKEKTRQTSAEQSGNGKVNGKGKGKEREPASTQTTYSMDEMEGATAGPSTPMDPSTLARIEGETKATAGHLTFKFRKFLRQMKNSNNWSEIAKRSVCHRCEDAPDDPWVTDCFHIYCHECLQAMHHEAARQGEDSAACLSCGAIFRESKACAGLNELGYSKYDHEDEQSNTTSRKSKSGTSLNSSPDAEKRDEESMAWIFKEGEILPSSKVTMVALTVDDWLKEDPNKKIIIFTQWRLMIKILEKFHGGMSIEARDKALIEFAENPDKKILISSLKCGGLGLNLTMASRVINLDLWWNFAIEQQGKLTSHPLTLLSY
ncbi:MAG: hypothetical protein M1822_003385 [Bathelium mastoideum]|nr:MAG: hypothetical protein M1822_003385 [Bathelium mastoideum]